MTYIVQNTVRGRDNRAVGSPAGREKLTPGGDPPPVQFHGNNELGATVSTTIAWSSNVATGTATAHGFTIGDIVRVSGANEAYFNGDFRVDSTVDANTFTYAVYGSGLASSGSGTILSGKTRDRIE